MCYVCEDEEWEEVPYPNLAWRWQRGSLVISIKSYNRRCRYIRYVGTTVLVHDQRQIFSSAVVDTVLQRVKHDCYAAYLAFLEGIHARYPDISPTVYTNPKPRTVNTSG